MDILFGCDYKASSPLYDCRRHVERVGNGRDANRGATSATSTMATSLNLPPSQEDHRPSFAERLETAISKKDVKLPITIKVSETELDDFLKERGEDIHIRWRFWRDEFIVEELNTVTHEKAIYSCVKQLGAADGQVRGLSAGLSPTLVAPAEYIGREMRPDGCIFNSRRKVNRRNRENGMAANEDGNYYPSVVVEVGFSQTQESLRNKIGAWLLAGNDRTGVRCVIEINIDDETTPPSFLQFRVHRRGQARTPRVTSIRNDVYSEDQKNKFRKLIPAEDVCYPDPVPDGFQGVTIDFWAIYASLPGIDTSDEDESSEDDEVDEDDGGSQVGQKHDANTGGVLGAIGSVLGKHPRSN